MQLRFLLKYYSNICLLIRCPHSLPLRSTAYRAFKRCGWAICMSQRDKYKSDTFFPKHWYGLSMV